MSETLGTLFDELAARHDDKIALQTLDGRSYRYGDINKRVNQLNAAIAELGLVKGARVAILAKNSPHTIEVFGLAKAGIIIVPLNWRLGDKELCALVDHCAPEVLFVDAEHLSRGEEISAQCACVKHLICWGHAEGPREEAWQDYEDFMQGHEPRGPVCDVAPTDPLCLIYTSGTTGQPKGVTITHQGALGNVRWAARQVMGMKAEDHVLAAMPLFHVGGLWYHFFPAFATGCTITMLPGFEAELVLREVEKRAITNTHLVPTMISALLAHPNYSSYDLSSLKTILYAASSMPTDLLKRAMKAFPGCDLVQSYGSTESGVVTCLDFAAHMDATEPGKEHILKSCGRAVAGCDIRICAESEILPFGEIGEIEVNSPNIMKGYWHNSEATAGAIEDGWLKTGDLGTLDEEGFLYIIDRKNDMIVTGGENVYPSEVEDQILKIDGIDQASVFGLPDEKWIEKVVAAIIPRAGAALEETEIIAALKPHLAAYKCPKHIFIVEDLPKNAAGKVLRRQLRDMFANE